MTDKLIIRTSDRAAFRRCRTRWDFTSKIRLNYEYVAGAEALDFGTAIHAAMEVFYDPARWDDPRSIVEAESTLAFQRHMEDWKSRLKKANQWDLNSEKWFEHEALGLGVLKHYYDNISVEDTVWEPLMVEQEFEVPIPVPQGETPPPPFDKDSEENLVAWLVGPGYTVPVVYQGRIDLIMRHKETDKIYVWDHKTRKKFDSYDHYELDTQCSSYVWAMKRILGVDIAGVIFQDIRKNFPKPPRELKSGKLSKDKSQETTPKLYRAAITELGLDPTEYSDFLAELEAIGKEYIRRIQVDRSDKELEIIERHIYHEALDMLNDPSIYPNPDAFNCGNCAFREPCIMRQDGSDWQWHLDHSLLYENRDAAKV